MALIFKIGISQSTKCDNLVNFQNQVTYHYSYNRAAAWIGYYRLLLDIIRYFLYSRKFMNFQVAKMHGIMACFMEVQKYRNSIHKALP